MKILLVSQDRDFLKVLAAVFQVHRPGYFTHSISTGRECLTHLKSSKVDLVILDTDLPDVSGFEGSPNDQGVR